MTDVTIFSQDGKVYSVLSHTLPAAELARETANEIRYMPKIPRARMQVVTIEEFKAMPFECPTKE